MLEAVQRKPETDGAKLSQPKAVLVGPSLAQLVAAQSRVEQAWREPSRVPAFTEEDLATIAYALGVLSQQRLAAGDSLEAVVASG